MSVSVYSRTYTRYIHSIYTPIYTYNTYTPTLYNYVCTGEDGMDAGGLTREWYSVLAREIFNANYALFKATIDNVTFQPNPQSYINNDHLQYFKFVGRVIGKAICDGQLMDAHFTRLVIYAYMYICV